MSPRMNQLSLNVALDRPGFSLRAAAERLESRRHPTEAPSC